MNEQLQQALANILNKTLNGVDAGSQFLATQLPEVIQQLLVWKFCDALMGVLFGLFLLVAAIRGFKRFEGQDMDEVNPFLFGIFTIAGLVGFLFLASGISEAVEIKVAPKIYLIEYAAKLTK